MNPRSLLEQFQQKEDEYLWIQEILTGQELIIDSTQQTIYRPYAHDKQKKYYSRKKKNHILKNQIITTEKGTEIVDVIVGKRGLESDVNLLIKQQKNFDKEQKNQVNKGNQGAQITMTQRKPRKQEMSPEMKEDNFKLAKKRIFVEHVIRLLKIFWGSLILVQIKRI